MSVCVCLCSAVFASVRVCVSVYMYCVICKCYKPSYNYRVLRLIHNKVNTSCAVLCEQRECAHMCKKEYFLCHLHHTVVNQPVQ